MTRFEKGTPIRFWLIPPDTRSTILMNTLSTGCRANPSFSYKLFLDSEYLEEEKKLSEYDILPDSLIVAELKEDR